MYATHPHPRPALVAALAALALALAALAPAALDDVSFSIGGADRSTATELPASAISRPQAEPAWRENPFAWPLLQPPGEAVHQPAQ